MSIRAYVPRNWYVQAIFPLSFEYKIAISLYSPFCLQMTAMVSQYVTPIISKGMNCYLVSTRFVLSPLLLNKNYNL